MFTRRKFLVSGVAASFAGGLYVENGKPRNERCLPQQGRLRPPRIKSAIRRDDMLLRVGGNGDGFHMSWDDRDRQLVAQQDGTGWFKDPKGVYNSRLWSMSADPHHAKFNNVAGYPDLIPMPSAPRYYGFGTLALDNYIYQYLSTLNSATDPTVRWVGAKLIYSPDWGETWHNQDGSTPVVWESWNERSRERMVFFEESQEAFSLLTILQMGRNYGANRDGYVYVYATNGNVDGSMNELVMFRAPTTGILNRKAYEYFSGLQSNGKPTWTKEIDARAVVHTFPRGWVNKGDRPGELVVESWLPSVTYNAPLDLYMMGNWGIGCAPNGRWFGKPSYLGFWIASDPWGPWMQIHEETAWMPDSDAAARAYDLYIAPKWISPDGKTFWLVWADFQEKGPESVLEQLRKESRPTDGLSRDAMRQLVSLRRRTMPYYSFNTQRVDLMLP